MSEEANTFFIFLDEEAQDLLLTQNVDLGTELERVTDGKIVATRALDPASDVPNKPKSGVMSLLAYGVNIYFLSLAISRVLDAIGRNKKPVLRRRVLRPVTTEQGVPAVTAEGKPILAWVDEIEMLEASGPPQQPSDKVEFSVGKEGLSVSLGEGKE